MIDPDEKFQSGKFALVNSLFYTQFFRYYYVSTISNENDWRPVELIHYPSVICVNIISRETKMPESPFCLRYFTPNKNRNYEFYANHLLILFYPFRTESNLKSDNSYTKKFTAFDLIYIVNGNRSIIELYCELVDEALIRYIGLK